MFFLFIQELILLAIYIILLIFYVMAFILIPPTNFFYIPGQFWIKYLKNKPFKLLIDMREGGGGHTVHFVSET